MVNCGEVTRQREQALGFQGWNIVERQGLGTLRGTGSPVRLSLSDTLARSPPPEAQVVLPFLVGQRASPSAGCQWRAESVSGGCCFLVVFGSEGSLCQSGLLEGGIICSMPGNGDFNSVVHFICLWWKCSLSVFYSGSHEASVSMESMEHGQCNGGAKFYIWINLNLGRHTWSAMQGSTALVY